MITSTYVNLKREEKIVNLRLLLFSVWLWQKYLIHNLHYYSTTLDVTTTTNNTMITLIQCYYTTYDKILLHTVYNVISDLMSTTNKSDTYKQ